MEHNKSQSSAAGYNLQDYTPMCSNPHDIDLKYAQYAKDLLDARLGINLKDLQQYMLRRGLGLGMSSTSESYFFKLGTDKAIPKDYFYGEYVLAKTGETVNGGAESAVHLDR